MSNGIRLTLLGAEHAEIAAAIHATAFAEPWPAEAFSKLLSEPLRVGALALADYPCGLILLQMTPDEAEVLTLAVAPPYRRLGAGRRLVEWAVNVVERAKLSRLVLEVNEHNLAARGLYDQLGFVEVGQRSGYYLKAQGVETALILARSVVRQEPTR